MQARTVLVAAALCAVALAAQAPPAFGGAWVSLFSPPYNTAPGIMMAMSCVSKDLCFVAGGSNGAGFDVFKFDGKINGNFVGELMPSKSIMIMGIGMGGTTEAPHGASGGMGIGNGVQYCANLSTFLPAKTSELMVVSQDVRASKSGEQVLVIDGNSGIVLASEDAGVTFATKKVTSPVPACATPRYGALANATTWYVTFGSWPENNNKQAGDYMLSGRAKLAKQADGSMKRVTFPMADVQAAPAPNNTCNGFTAAIAKTTDGGATWSTVFTDSTTYYFNAIDCSTPTNCVAVAEGPQGTYIFQTTDGKVFKKVLFTPSSKKLHYSFMAIKFVSATEAWVGGSKAVSQFDASAAFLRSMDGGATWIEYPHGLPNLAEVTDMSFVEGGKVGFATAMTTFDDSTIIRFEHGAKPADYFTQKQCSAKGCKAFCQDQQFPLGRCLEVGGGGSAINTCGATALMQKSFANTTNCAGASTAQTLKLNTCLKDNQGSYFEVSCKPPTTGAFDGTARRV
jgi:photosystem II stability/assembly factor-like uncharacterized protein